MHYRTNRKIDSDLVTGSGEFLAFSRCLSLFLGGISSVVVSRLLKQQQREAWCVNRLVEYVENGTLFLQRVRKRKPRYPTRHLSI